VKFWDVIIIGGGVIGLSLSIALRKRGATVLVVERGEPGQEASHAAAGMLADFPLETPPILQPLATASAGMYPEFVHELQDESGLGVDLREQGTIFFPSPEQLRERPTLLSDHPLPLPLAELEPCLAHIERPAIYLKERSVDPALTAAALKAARHRGVTFLPGRGGTAVLLSTATPRASALTGRATGSGSR
jgi:glycine oxidase